jgi:hypothetical protein
MKTLIPCIWIAGGLQLFIASLNVVLPKKLNYAENLAKVSTIVRQVFVVHSVYIGLILVFFGLLSLLFAPELAGATTLGRFLSAFLAVFWSLRVGIQLFYYDPALKRQNRLAHFVFTLIFVYLAAVYTVAAIGTTG